MSDEKPKNEAELSDKELDQATGGAEEDHVLTLEGVAGESNKDKKSSKL